MTRIYGASWSLASWEVRQFLSKLEVEFEYIDIEKDTEAAAWVAQHHPIKPILPILELADGTVLTAPSHHALAKYFGYQVTLGASGTRKTRPMHKIDLSDLDDEEATSAS